jgi:cell division protein FtsI/penicillin-binding protein 2
MAALAGSCTPAAAGPAPEQAAAQKFLDALARCDAAGAAAATTDPAAAQPVIARFCAALRQGDPGARITAELGVTGLAGRTASAATAEASLRWHIPGGTAPWAYSAALPMAKVPASPGSRKTAWKLTWAPSDLHPQLGAGEAIQVVRTQPPRANLLDAAGAPLFAPTEVVTVGVVPNEVSDPAGEAAILAARLGVRAEDIVADLNAARPGRGDQFITVVTVRRAVYDQARDAIYDLPGVQFRASTQLLGPSAGFARQLLGAVGPATADLVAASGGRLRPGDQTGIGGLQQALDAQLGGVAGLRVQLINPDGSAGAPLGTLTDPQPGADIQLTIDQAVQGAADAALSALPEQAALVAVRPSTGQILAVANSASAGDDIALVGQYPPGSTFKIITATAALGANPALGPDSPQNCPGTITVDGRRFQNYDQFALGPVDLRTAFAKSCNTTFIALGSALPASALPNAAGALGVGADWALPVASFSGSVPPPASATLKAADSIGQGTVLMSPLAMAMVAAAAQSGRPIAPALTAAGLAQPGAPLPPATAAALADMMRAVVTSGTATSLADLPGGVSGKTGTAEYGTADPPRAHSWFVGFRGDLALAVFIADGQNSGASATLTAKRFLSSLPA